MLRLPRRSLLIALALALAGAGLWGAGCDFTRVDVGADAPLADHLVALTGARSQGEAEGAIRGLMNKLQIGTAWSPEASPYAGFALSEAELAALAARQHRFNGGDGAVGTPAHAIHERVAWAYARLAEYNATSKYPIRPAPPSLTTSYGDVRTSLEILAHQAQWSPEDPRHGLILAITDGGAYATPSEPLSPVQQFLLVAWLHAYGDDLPRFAVPDGISKANPPKGGNASCPFGNLVAKFETNRDGASDPSHYDLETGGGVEIVDVDIRSGNLQEVRYITTEPVCSIIVKASTQTTDENDRPIEVELPSDQFAGSFSNAGLFPNGNSSDLADISNVQLCGCDPPYYNGTPDCTETCLQAFMADIANGVDVSEAIGNYEACINRCHDQGSGSGG